MADALACCVALAAELPIATLDAAGTAEGTGRFAAGLFVACIDEDTVGTAESCVLATVTDPAAG